MDNLRRVVKSDMRQSAFVLICCLAVACTQPPTQLRNGPFSELTPVDAQQESAVGRRVRWGGDIVSVKPGEELTCFEVIDRPLGRDARPRDTDETLGRFITCALGFYDPAIYDHGRQLTVIGTLETPAISEIGRAKLVYPRVLGERLYLWPRRKAASGSYGPWVSPSWEPYWGPWTSSPPWGYWW